MHLISCFQIVSRKVCDGLFLFLPRLSLCEKALAEYLETKRLAFPRFYFVSSADLLDILSKGNQPIEVEFFCFYTLLNCLPVNGENFQNFKLRSLSNENFLISHSINYVEKRQLSEWSIVSQDNQ